METVKKRIEWVDTGKFFCIMFVMLSHLESGSAALDRFYTPFFLPMFFFLSGYVYRQPASFRVHLGKKVRGLLIPWLVFSNGSILLSMALNRGGAEYISVFGWNLLQIREHGDEMWFVSALFVAFIPFYFLAKSKKPGRALVLTAALAVLETVYYWYMPVEWFPWGTNKLPWHLDFVFQAAMWMLLGFDFRQYGERFFDKYNTALGRLGLWTVYLTAISLPRFMGIGYSFWAYVESGLGILAVMSVCKVVKSCRYIRFVGANTLTYFGLHGWIYAAVETVLGRLDVYAMCLGNPWTSSALAVGITLAVSLILILPAQIINKWFPWVLGRKKAA